eukprot:12075821-Ditylum_brightwellii.AAC.1
MENTLNSWEDKFNNIEKMMGMMIEIQQMASVAISSNSDTFKLFHCDTLKVSTHDSYKVSVPNSLKLSLATIKDYSEVSDSWKSISMNDDNESRKKNSSISSYYLRLTYNHVQESYLKSASIACIFQQYYTKNVEELYKKHKPSTTDDKNKKSNNQKMFQYCQVILHVLMFLDKMPPKDPMKA